MVALRPYVLSTRIAVVAMTTMLNIPSPPSVQPAEPIFNRSYFISENPIFAISFASPDDPLVNCGVVFHRYMDIRMQYPQLADLMIRLFAAEKRDRLWSQDKQYEAPPIIRQPFDINCHKGLPRELFRDTLVPPLTIAGAFNLYDFS